MLYISKGILNKKRDNGSIDVVRCGKKYNLCASDAQIWLAGRHALTRSAIIPVPLQLLGLLTWTECDHVVSRYSLLAECAICCYNPARSDVHLSDPAVMVLEWLHKAPLHLTAEELVRISELGLLPERDLLARQALIEAIYTNDTIEDHALRIQMQYSPALIQTVSAIEELLQKEYIFMI